MTSKTLLYNFKVLSGGSSLLITYVVGGLFLWAIEILWNHGLFGSGADVIPTWIEILGFIFWIIVGLIGLVLISGKKLKSIILVVSYALVAVGLFFIINYILGEIIPNIKMVYNVKMVVKNAETICEVPSRQGMALNTLILDTENKLLYYWRHDEETAKQYDSLISFSIQISNITFEELPQSQIMYKIPYKDGLIYCLSDENYYDEIEFIYWLYDGQMYFSDVENIFWYGNTEKMWEEYKNSRIINIITK